MNNEKYNQIIDEAYENYTNYPLATIHNHHTNTLYQNMHKGWCIINGRSMVSPHPTRYLTTEEFINKCKTDTEFSEKWGLKIEERGLSLEERHKILNDNVSELNGRRMYVIYDGIENEKAKFYDEYDIPTKLITITYKNETIKSYE